MKKLLSLLLCYVFLQTETFALYREYGVNPFGGCLPALIQMPVFFSLYFMLQNAVELRGQSFLWVHDLSQPDTLFTIPGLGWIPFLGNGVAGLPVNVQAHADVAAIPYERGDLHGQELEHLHTQLPHRQLLGEDARTCTQLDDEIVAEYARAGDDVSGDGWTDLAGYSRGVIRPRFYWDNKTGSTALLTAGFTYEDRSGGTTDGGTLPATGAPYTEALLTRRYDLGGNYQSLIGSTV